MTNDYGMFDIQKKLLNAVKTFDAFCRENEIKYSLHAGTLLGAVREKGFIPWDDDIDIAMSRKEYEKLKVIFEKNKYSEMRFEYATDKIKKIWFKDTSTVWLDIFICDYISEKPVQQKLKKTCIKVFSALTKTSDTIKTFRMNNRAKGVSGFVYEILYALSRPIPIERRMQAFDIFCQKRFTGNKEFMIRSNEQLIYMPIVFPKDYMQEYEYIPFEDTNLMVSTYYHDILSKFYGEDYMTPKKATSTQKEVHDEVRKRI